MPETKLIAFDYASQKWIEGEPARALRVRQLREELETLTSPGSSTYLRMIGSKLTRAEAVDSCVEQLAALGESI